MEKKINEKNNNKKEENDFYKDEYVDVINTNDGTVSGGKIISIKDDIMLIKNLKTNKEEQYKKNDNSILKQWKPGRPFLIFNRLDIQLIYILILQLIILHFLFSNIHLNLNIIPFNIKKFICIKCFDNTNRILRFEIFQQFFFCRKFTF